MEVQRGFAGRMLLENEMLGALVLDAAAGIGLSIGSHVPVAGADVSAPHTCSSCRVGGTSPGALVPEKAADVPMNLFGGRCGFCFRAERCQVSSCSLKVIRTCRFCAGLDCAVVWGHS